MLLQKQLKELGEWFQDTYKGYELETQYVYSKKDNWEEYYLVLSGPPDFKTKRVGLIIKDEWSASGDLDIIRDKFVPANKRAIAASIEAYEMRDVTNDITQNEVRMVIPDEVIEEAEAKAKEGRDTGRQENE